MVRPNRRGQVADAAAQGESPDAGGGDEARGCGQTECMRGVVHLTPGAAAPDPDGLRHRVKACVP